MKIGKINKALVAAVVPALTYTANDLWDFGLRDVTLGIITAAVTAILVWAIPNFK